MAGFAPQLRWAMPDPSDHAAFAARYSALLSQLYARPIVHDAYRTLEGDEGQLLRIDRDGYRLLYVERGQGRLEFATADAEAMLFRLLADSAFWSGVDFECKHRIEGPDFRRMVHAHQRELFARLGPDWGALLECKIAATLAEHPYRDATAS